MLLGGEIIWNEGLVQEKMLCLIPTRKIERRRSKVGGASPAQK